MALVGLTSQLQVVVGAFDAVPAAPAVLADVHLALALALWMVVVGTLAWSSLEPSPDVRTGGNVPVLLV